MNGCRRARPGPSVQRNDQIEEQIVRQIVLDTETTGLEPELGHRIIEVGCVELVNRRKSKNNFQRYVNPERGIDEAAVEVHGITQGFLANKPLFSDIAEDLLDYLRDAELIIHNAAFDISFLNYELGRVDSNLSIEDYCTVTDTLSMARKTHPGQRNSLDALCKRYGIDNSQRTYHGALLDAEILADVYLAMTGGQTALTLSLDTSYQGNAENNAAVDATSPKPTKIVYANDEELDAHEAWLDHLEKESGSCIWRQPTQVEFT
jgi:DNA polymerase-3 subunit epsilon